MAARVCDCGGRLEPRTLWLVAGCSLEPMCELATDPVRPSRPAACPSDGARSVAACSGSGDQKGRMRFWFTTRAVRAESTSMTAAMRSAGGGRKTLKFSSW